MTTHQSPSQAAQFSNNPKGKIADTADAVAGKATETARVVADQANELADRAVQQGREFGAMAQQVPGAAKNAIDTSLKQQPMATLAVAAVLGFALGALWKS